MNFKKNILSKSVATVLLGASPFVALAQDGAGEAEAPPEFETIVVTGTYSANLINALEQKRSSPNVVDVVLAEDIGKFPDLTTSDALQRVPGVQVARGAGETNNVVVRGLPNVKTTIEGRSMFSTTSRGFAFQDLPAEALAGVEVYKSRSAEQVEGGIAGLVNLRLRRPFDFDGFKGVVSGRITDDEYAEDTDKVASALVSNRWEAGDGEFGALFNVSLIDDYFQQSNTFTAETLPTDRTPSGETVGIPLSVGIVSDKGLRERAQANMSLQWRPNDELELYFDSLYSGLDHQQHTIFGIGFIDGNDLTNVTLNSNPELCTDIGQTEPVCYVASGTANGTQFLAGTHAITSNVDISQSAAGFKWDLSDDTKLKSELVYTDTDRQYENFIQDWHYYGINLNFVSNVNNHTNFDVVGGGTTDPDNFVSGGLFQPWDDSVGSELAWTLDVEHELNAGAFTRLQSGIRFADREGEFRAGDMAAFDGAGLTGDTFGDNYLIPVDMGGATYLDLPGFVAADYEYMLDNKADIRRVYGISEDRPEADPLRNFDAQEETLAAYVQAHYENQLFGYDIDGMLGLRAMNLDRTMSSFGEQDGVRTEFVDDTSTTEVLPNASLNMYFNDQTILRSSVSKTISLPAFSDLNPNLFTFPPAPGTPVGSGSGGNPDLDPIESISYDLSLEYYMEDGGIASVALFYRDVKGYISIFSQEEVIDGQRYNISRPFSSGDGTLEGAEIAYTKFFTELPEPFDGLGVQLNYTFIDGEVNLPDGQGGEFTTELAQVAEHNGNAVLIYETGDLFARVAYNYRGDYIESFTTPGIQEPKTSNVRSAGRVDASIGYNITDNFTVTVDGTNLNDEKFYNYWGHPERSRDRRDPGRTISIGASYQF
ncbi:TonB-dependent receptor [Marinimicrobium sp. C6131]|uniref:TonB-dependent receptor n=1 Tax=Marinimicrobium sp. C6131 TaxID=3022676 RepID=UPI00223E1B69|nr:TonB-dependent receptor [Marinimicrobium sp. C6131]UZJ43624.1 TonB-dependent receptor [Marinimicrobium sp. C6131]